MHGRIGAMLRMGVAALALGAALPALAWGELGHKVIGDLAMQRLHAQARAEVQLLLAGERDPTLGGVASWADALRYNDGRRFRATSRWHFINARGGGCDFLLARDCPDGDCVLGAIRTQHALLADRTQPLAARRDALKFLVHFVGDVHQPMHASPREDSGGNGFQVSLARAGRNGTPAQPQGTNLHSVWDASVLSSAGLNRRQYVEALSPRLPARLPAARAEDALAWASHACSLVEARQLYPASHSIGEEYLQQHRPLAEEQLLAAAVRLAALVNEALGPGPAGARR